MPANQSITCEVMTSPHCRARATTTPADTCIGAQRRNFLLGIRRSRPPGHLSKAGAQSTSATQVAPVGSARPASLLREVPGTLRRYRCYAVDDRPWAGPSHPAAAYVYSEDRRGEHPATHYFGKKRRERD